jgi:hypothetical protein
MIEHDASAPKWRLDPIHIAWAVKLLVVFGILAMAGLSR